MKKYAKLIIIFSVLAAMLLSLTACQIGGTKKITVGWTTFGTDNEFIAGLTNGVKELFKKDGIDMQIVDCNADSAKQINQIENFTTMGTTVIIVLPQDAPSLKDACQRAMDKGSLIYAINDDTGAYNSFMHSDRAAIGRAEAKMAADWINKTFPDAADKSIEVAIFENRNGPALSAMCDAMATIESICPKAKLVQKVGGMVTNQGGQEAAASLLQAHPNLKVIMSLGSEAALGANAYAMLPDTKISDKSKFAIFTGDWSEEIRHQINLSLTNESVYRGSVKFGSDDLIGDIYRQAKKMATGETYKKELVDPYVAIDSRNIAKYNK